MSKDLSKLFLPEFTGRGVQDWMSGFCTAWDAVTSHSTVVVGGVVTYTNLPILAPAVATMTTGLVLLSLTDRGPIIHGRLIVPV